jgi:hypothetical protein
MSVQPIAPGSAVALPDAGDRDWLAAAAGFGGGAVRAAHGGREIVGLLPYGSVAPQAVPGPFALAWSEGSPVVRGMSNTWLTETAAGAGFRVSAPSAGTDIGTLVVYAGALGHQAHVTARLDGGGSGASVNLPAPSGAAGYVLTIRFRALRGGDTVLLDLSADPGGGVGMAAIELR